MASFFVLIFLIFSTILRGSIGTMFSRKIMTKPTLLATTIFALLASSIAQNTTQTPPAKVIPAELVIAQAASIGKRKGNNILVIFHASWCGWCHKLDKFLDTTPEGKLIKSNFEVVHLTVMENGDKKTLENPGGMEFLTQLGGEKAGLPYFAILDAKNRSKIMDSLKKPGDGASNTGYPASQEEIGHFMKMLEAGSKKLSKADLGKIQTWLVTNAPK